jgi:hypothetical protein
MDAVNSLANRLPSAARSSRQRSAVSNGTRPFINGDGRSAWARRWKDIAAEFVADLGGAACLTEAQRQLIRRCATLALAAERAEAEIADGKAIDVDLYVTLCNGLGRCLARLGVKSRAASVPDPLDYAAKHLESAR